MAILLNGWILPVVEWHREGSARQACYYLNIRDVEFCNLKIESSKLAKKTRKVWPNIKNNRQKRRRGIHWTPFLHICELFFSKYCFSLVYILKRAVKDESLSSVWACKAGFLWTSDLLFALLLHPTSYSSVTLQGSVCTLHCALCSVQVCSV